MFAFNTWGGLLNNLLDQTDEHQRVKDYIKDLINAGDYFKAADELENSIDSDVFYFSLASAFSDNVFVKNGIPYIPDDAAVRWLPIVFPYSRLLTTNYDSVLEWAYAQQKLYLKVCTPKDDRMFMQFMPRRLFKIHGSYDSNYEDIVLTAKSYAQKYDPESSLYKNFKALVRNSVLLFIGVSLRADKTLDLLKEIAEELTTQGEHYSGNMHFAILHIGDNEDRPERKRQLAQYKILPILYSDKDHEGFEDKHTIVSVILEHLFNDIKRLKAEDKTTISFDHDISDHYEIAKNEKDPLMASGGFNSSILAGVLRDNPLAALAFALSQNNLSIAEEIMPELEKALPSEVFITKALMALVSRGSTVAANRLLSAFETPTYEKLTVSQRIAVIGALVSYCNRLDKEILFLDRIDKMLKDIEPIASEKEKGSIYNQYARLFFGAYENDERDDFRTKAEEYAKKAVEYDPNQPSYHYNLAFIIKNRDLDAAIDTISKCINLDSKDPEHLSLAYELYHRAGNERADEIYKKLETIDPIRAKMVRLTTN